MLVGNQYITWRNSGSVAVKVAPPVRDPSASVASGRVGVGRDCRLSVEEASVVCIEIIPNTGLGPIQAGQGTVWARVCVVEDASEVEPVKVLSECIPAGA